MSWAAPSNLNEDYFVVEVYQDDIGYYQSTKAFTSPVTIGLTDKRYIYKVTVKASKDSTNVWEVETEVAFGYDTDPNVIADLVVNKLNQESDKYINAFDFDLTQEWWGGLVVINLEETSSVFTLEVVDTTSSTVPVTVLKQVMYLAPHGSYRVNVGDLAPEAETASVFITSDYQVKSRAYFGNKGSLAVQN